MNTTRKKRRKTGGGKLGFVYTLLVMLALLFVLALSIGLFFKTSRIEVDGNHIYTEEEIVRMSMINIGENIFFINKFSAIRNIFDSLPYIQEVRIRRKLPSTVVVMVTETSPLGVFEFQGYYWLFNETGKLLGSEAAVRAPQYPLIKGVSLLSPSVGEQYVFPSEEKVKEEPLLEVLKAIHKAGLLEKVNELDISNVYDISFRYDGRFTVILGMPSDIDYKLRFLNASLSELDDTATGSIELSQAMDGIVHFIPYS